MRVIAGKARSLRLAAPRGQETRPTTDRIKETLFNILQPYLADSVFVDLFSGSGGIGIEALSRGAKRAWFIENAAEPWSCILRNIESTGMKDRAFPLRRDVLLALPMIREEEADIIFMDPPYGMGLERKVLSALKDRAYVSRHTLIIVEALRNADFSFAEEMGYEIRREKNYQTNKHVFLRSRGPL